jgi:NAD(P)-dependent dehydrogenase (short-subunit alcohol dehydrogenase family)
VAPIEVWWLLAQDFCTSQTHTNIGLGLAILQSLIAQSPGDIYCLGSRSKTSAAAVLQELRKQEVNTHIDVVELDITVNNSIDRAIEQIKNAHGRLDGKQFLRTHQSNLM